MSLEILLNNIETFLENSRRIYGDYFFLDNLELDSTKQNFNITDNLESNKNNSGETNIIKTNSKTSITQTKETKNSNKSEFKINSNIELEDFNNKIKNCQLCPLGSTRNKFVFGSGNPNADVIVIGEAPGADEDKQGLPFVGRAGQLLTKILESVGFSREEVFICNIIKCRPPENRKPLLPEIDSCEPYLHKQIELIKPKLILVLGLTAVDTLLKNKHAMAETRGKIFEYHNVKVFVTYHPSALLRNPNLKRPVWEDMQAFRKLYDEML